MSQFEQVMEILQDILRLQNLILEEIAVGRGVPVEAVQDLFGEDPVYEPRHAAPEETVIRAAVPGATRTRVEALEYTGENVEVPMDDLSPLLQAIIKESVTQQAWFQVYRDRPDSEWRITADDAVVDAVRKSGISPQQNAPDPGKRSDRRPRTE